MCEADKLFIAKNGEIVFRSVCDGGDKWNDVILKESEVLFYLDKAVILQEEFTLRDYFKVINLYYKFQLLDSYFTDFLKEYNSCPKQKCKDDYIKYLELRRIVEYSPEYKFYMSDSLMFEENMIVHTSETVDTYIDFHGVDKNDNGVAIEFGSLKRILDCEIKLAETKIIINQNDIKEYPIIYKGPDDISLFEFIKYIIWELSFCGSPIERDKKFEEITKVENNDRTSNI